MADKIHDRHIIPSGNIIDGYEVVDLIGAGGFGGIYKVKDQQSGDELFAMKTESLDSNRHTLPIEISIIKELHDEYFPKYRGSGKNDQFQINYLVMNYLGASIGEIQAFHEYKLEIDVVYHVSLIMLGVIKGFHSYGYIHRDIKPNNFLIQQNEQYPLVLIDFGLSKKHIDPETKKPFPREEESIFLGTRKYTSIDILKMHSCGRKDDLISWFYSFLDLACGKLPWDDIKDAKKVIEMRKSFKLADLNYKFPDEFQQIYDYIKKLNYEDEPDYDHIKDLFQAGMENDLVFVGQFDWPGFISKHSHMTKFQKEISLCTVKLINEKNEEKREEIRNEESDEKKGHCLIC